MKGFDEKEKAVIVEASLEDFDGDVAKWKNCFYELWRYQLTWNFAWNIRLLERRDGVYVRLLIRPSYEKNLKDLMEYLGYKNVTTAETNVGLLSAYDNDFIDEDIDSLFIDW